MINYMKISLIFLFNINMNSMDNNNMDRINFIRESSIKEKTIGHNKFQLQITELIKSNDSLTEQLLMKSVYISDLVNNINELNETNTIYINRINELKSTNEINENNIKELTEKLNCMCCEHTEKDELIEKMRNDNTINELNKEIYAKLSENKTLLDNYKELKELNKDLNNQLDKEKTIVKEMNEKCCKYENEKGLLKENVSQLNKTIEIIKEELKEYEIQNQQLIELLGKKDEIINSVNHHIVKTETPTNSLFNTKRKQFSSR